MAGSASGTLGHSPTLRFGLNHYLDLARRERPVLDSSKRGTPPAGS